MSRLPFPLLLLLLLGVLLLLAFLSLHLGYAGRIPLGDWASLLRPPPGSEDPRALILLEIRLPRLAYGLLAGSALGLSGLAVQTLFRNPLAEPYLLGVSSGAALGAVLALGAGLPALLGALALPAAAFAGSWAVLGLVLLLAHASGRLTPTRLLLAGLALSGLLQALTSGFLLLRHPWEFHTFFFWMLGSLSAQSGESLVPLALATAAGTGGLFFHARALNLLATGEITAHTLGLPVAATRFRLAALAALLASAATAACGLIAFAGLLIPHLARLLAGANHFRLLPVCLLLGPALLLASDLLARLLLPGRELPLSLVTGALGCFFLLLLLFRPDVPGAPRSD